MFSHSASASQRLCVKRPVLRKHTKLDRLLPPNLIVLLKHPRRILDALFAHPRPAGHWTFPCRAIFVLQAQRATFKVPHRSAGWITQNRHAIRQRQTTRAHQRPFVPLNHRPIVPPRSHAEIAFEIVIAVRISVMHVNLSWPQSIDAALMPRKQLIYLASLL